MIEYTPWLPLDIQLEDQHRCFRNSKPNNSPRPIGSSSVFGGLILLGWISRIHHGAKVQASLFAEKCGFFGKTESAGMIERIEVEIIGKINIFCMESLSFSEIQYLVQSSSQKTMLQSALKVSSPGHVSVASGIAIPSIQPDEALVRVRYVALNPVDAKSVDLSPTQGATVGCDFAGEVVEIGAAVEKPLTAGDRVCGCIFGNNPAQPGNGAFAEFVAVPGDLLLRVPAEMTLQSAATLGVGLATSGLALYQALELPWPRLDLFEPETQVVAEASSTSFILISGGGTATGTLAIQLARA